MLEMQPPAETCKVIFLEPDVDHETEWGPALTDAAGVAPAPKFQAQEAPTGAEPVKVNVLFANAQIVGMANVKVEVGVVFTENVFEDVAVQLPEVTVKFIVLEPVDEQETLCGPTPVAVEGVAPAPKLQAYVEPTGATPV